MTATDAPLKLSYDDSNHQYRLNGKLVKSISKVAGIPDDRYNIEQWAKRSVALGMALDPALASRAIANHDDKRALGGVAEDALRAAKAYEKANKGTEIHRTLERHDLGEAIIDTAENRALRRAYDKALEAAGLSVVPEYIERIVVHPDRKIVGRYDRIFKRKRDGKHIIADVKSGTNAVLYPHSTSVQMALYAFAPLQAEPLPRDGGTTEVFEPLPDNLDLKWGAIIHTPDPDTVEVVYVDIAKGWKIAKQAIFPILDWRADKELTKREASMAISDVTQPAADERVDWIVGRLELIKMLDNTDAARTLVANRWPRDVPTPKSSAGWTESDIDSLDVVLASVERDCVAPFPVKDPLLVGATE